MSLISLRSALLVLVVSVVVLLFFDHGPTRLPVHVDGRVEEKFAAVRDIFTQNFVDGWERGGASLVVMKDGKTVVDLWGGYADRAALRKWKEDTLQITFSTTKGVASVCVAMLVDRGYLSYDDLVTKYWPEFGKHGKGNLTVEMLLTHQAGLVYLDENLTEEDVLDHRVISKRFEDQRPHWPPGTATGYHIYSFGWLVDQLVRRADPKKRSIGQFFREEVHQKYGIDYHIGLPSEHAARVARLMPPSMIDRIGEIIFDVRVGKTLLLLGKLVDQSAHRHGFLMEPPCIRGIPCNLYPCTEGEPCCVCENDVCRKPRSSALSRALQNVGFLEAVHQMTVNNPDYWKIEQAAALGIGNARSLAQIYSLVLEKKLISEKTLKIISKPSIDQLDVMSGDTVPKGHGFFYSKKSAKPFLFGHPGHGCQQTFVDLENGLSLAYTTNALKMAHTPELCRTWKRIRDVIYDVIDGKQ